MKIIKEDETLDALIDMFNEQIKRDHWDVAYGTATAIAEHYQQCADSIRSNIVHQLKIGVVNRARATAEAQVAGKRG